jgi:hypothetical protein
VGAASSRESELLIAAGSRSHDLSLYLLQYYFLLNFLSGCEKNIFFHHHLYQSERFLEKRYIS